jgi:uncharacterized membrane protein
MASSSMEQALKMAVVTGMRAALGPALVARAQHRPEQQHLALAALGELVFDKLPYVPSRDALPSLIVRGLAGAWAAGKCVDQDGENADPWAAPLGAAVAVGVAVVAPKVRESLGWALGVPQPVLGLIEDYLALRLGAEAMGLSMGQVSDAAQETVGGLGGRFNLEGLKLPWAEAQSTGAGSM